VAAELAGRADYPWTRFEIDVAVAAYAEMLDKEVRGEPYTKAAVVRQVEALLPARTPGSIERKFANISAVLDETGIAPIPGYKGLRHYQGELARVVVAYFAGPGRRTIERLADFETNTLPPPQAKRLATSDVLVPPPASRPWRGRGSSVHLTGGR
jgi:hypothetical protein